MEDGEKGLDGGDAVQGHAKCSLPVAMKGYPWP